jgi:NhaA family Na+:H+ antiporter
MFARGGIEGAVVGVVVGIAGLASPASAADVHRLGPRAWEQRLNPVVNLVVLPLFALANTGVDLGRLDLSASAAALVFVGVFLARVVGKPVGVWLGVTLLPSRYVSSTEGRPSARIRLGLGTVASVGYTVPLLIARVAFSDPVLTALLLTARSEG